jgi:hypothetical protein
MPSPSPSLAVVLFGVQLVSTLLMTGVIWFVQVVHYPLFAWAADAPGTDARDPRGIGGADAGRTSVDHAWPRYAAEHGRRTTWIVAPPMLAELASAAALVHWRPAWIDARAAWLGLALVGVIWASTALLQVPRHDALRREWSAHAHRALVRSNWLRTVAWTTRAVLLLAVAGHALAR